MKPIHFATLAAAGLLAGCGSGDARFEKLAVGITKDSAMSVMGVQRPQRTDAFLIEGKFIEVMYYNPEGTADSIADRKMSPIVVVNGTLNGWGWKSLDSVAEATKIKVAPK
jgi:hypothetical protein